MCVWTACAACALHDWLPNAARWWVQSVWASSTWSTWQAASAKAAQGPLANACGKLLESICRSLPSATSSVPLQTAAQVSFKTRPVS